MDSTRVPVLTEKRRRQDASSDHLGSSGGGDLISSLDDDVLAHMLGLLPTMTDVVRACAVSRRLRHLKARVPILRFNFVDDVSYKKENMPDHYYFKQREEICRFIAFVNHVLVRRIGQSEAGIEELAISHREVVGKRVIDAAQVDAWIRYGMQQAMKSFTFKLHLPNNLSFNSNNMVLYELPSSTRLETMILSLNYASLKLPPAVTFDSLTDLSLSGTRLAAGSGDILGRLLSSACCPRLRKLSLDGLGGLTELKLEAGELLELSLCGTLDSVGDVLIELNTPRLRVLSLDYGPLRALTISAPRLEELMSTFVDWRDVEVERRLDVGDLSCVRSLGELELHSHGHPVDDAGRNDFAIHLLQRCTSVECLTVFLVSSKEYYDLGEEEEAEEVDDLIKNILHMPHVTSLTINANLPNERVFMTAIACLFERCSFLKYLQLDMIIVNDIMLTTTADNQATWEDNFSTKLPHLEEIQISDFLGLEYQTGLMEWLYAISPALQKIQVKFDRETTEYQNLLPRIPFAEVGQWESAPSDRNCETFVWTRIITSTDEFLP